MAEITHYVLDGTKIVKEYRTTSANSTQTNVKYYFYDASGSIAGFEYNGNKYYFQKNIQGDIIRICDTSGNTVAEYTYDAWGKILSIKDGSGNDVSGNASHIANINPFRYRGYYYDTETGFYYLQTRYYDPEVGRFLNADCYIGANGDIQGYNSFAYCSNNPVMHGDPTGEGFWKELKNIGKKVIQAAAIITAVVVVAAVTSATIIGTGGAGAAVLAPVLAIVDKAVGVCVATAVVGTTAVAVGVIGENVCFSKGDEKGKSFRGGSKSQRDKWFGHDEKEFHKWFERVGKKRYNYGNDIDTKKICDELYEIWKELGCPFPK